MRRSRYLVTLTHSPAWSNIDGRLRPTAYREYLKTVKLANQLIDKGKIKGPYYGPKKRKRR